MGRLETSKLLKRSVLRVAEMFARRTHFQLSLSEFNTEKRRKAAESTESLVEKLRDRLLRAAGDFCVVLRGSLFPLW